MRDISHGEHHIDIEANVESIQNSMILIFLNV